MLSGYTDVSIGPERFSVGQKQRNKKEITCLSQKISAWVKVSYMGQDFTRRGNNFFGFFVFLKKNFNFTMKNAD